MSEIDRAPAADAIPDPVLVIDGDGVLQFANLATVATLGWAPHELVGTPVMELLHSDDHNIARAAIATSPTKEMGDVITMRVRARDGSWRRLELRSRRSVTDGALQTTVVARDVSDRHRFGLDQGNDQLLRSVVENMNSMIVVIDRDGTIRSFNAAVTNLLGHDPDVVRGTNLSDVIHPDEQHHVIQSSIALRPMDSVHLDARLRDLDGNWVTCDFTVKNLCDDPVVDGYLVSGEVATSLDDARLRAEFLAQHDTRTGLLNRDGFLRAATTMLGTARGLGVMIIDIVRFRSMNELYGELAGDAVLMEVADRLDRIQWPGLITARFGGDEFVVAIPSPDDAAIRLLRERVERELAPPVQIGDLEISLPIRVASVHDLDPDGLEPLLARASSALMSAKRSQDDESADTTFESLLGRRARLDRLHRALSNGEIQPFFQPIVDPDGVITSVEALVRWMHPEHGVLGVAEFLPLARMAGLTEAIDRHVLEKALDLAGRMDAAGYGHVEVHVNVDPKVIGREAFASMFLQCCEQHGVTPSQMVVEITETDLLAPGLASLENLSELRRAGTQVTIDDFGTGFSSLSHLMILPVDGVKIDKSFVAGLGSDTAATNLTRAILGLAQSLDLSCVAEGVEQASQYHQLVSFGCTAFQGWRYSPAVHPEELLALLPRIIPAGSGT